MSESKKIINLPEEVNKIYTDANRGFSMQKIMLQEKHKQEMAALDGEYNGYYKAIRDVEQMLERLKLK